MRRKSLYGSGNLFKVNASKIKLNIEYNGGWQHTPVIGNPFSMNSNTNCLGFEAIFQNSIDTHSGSVLKFLQREMGFLPYVLSLLTARRVARFFFYFYYII